MELRTAPMNVWLIAGTSAFEPYPCRCRSVQEGRWDSWRGGTEFMGADCNPKYCPCSGRTDLDQAPASCCRWVNTPAAAAAAQRR
jgi:hypothetical protein